MSGTADIEAARAKRIGRDAAGRFLPGHGGLRPRGSRYAGPLAFRDALQADWREHGAACIARLRRDDPVRYLLIVLAIVPRRWGGKGR